MGDTGSEEKQSKVLSRIVMPDCMISQESESGFAFSHLEQIYKECNGECSLVHGDISVVFGKAYRYNQINFGEFT